MSLQPGSDGLVDDRPPFVGQRDDRRPPVVGMLRISGLAAVLGAATPFIVAGFAYPLLGDRPTRRLMIAAGIGIAGIALLGQSLAAGKLMGTAAVLGEVMLGAARRCRRARDPVGSGAGRTCTVMRRRLGTGVGDCRLPRSGVVTSEWRNGRRASLRC